MTPLSKSILLLISLTLFFRLEAQETKQISLQEARDYAVEHNINIKNAELDVEKSKKEVWETTAIGLPQVNSSFRYNNNIDLSTQLLPGEFFGQPGEFVEVQFGTQHNATFNVNANQIIFDGPYLVALKASQTFLNISKHQQAKTKIETKYSVTEAYYSVLVARQNINVLQNSQKNVEQLLNDIQKTYQQGLAEETDVDQVQINLSEIENQINTLQRQVDVGKSVLKFQMGMPMKNEITLSDSLPGILDQINLQEVGAKNFNVSNHIDYKIVDTKEKANMLQMRREKSEYLPSLSAFYTHQQNAMREEFNYFDGTDNKWFKSNVIGLKVDVPIFSSGSRLSKVQQAQIELEKTKNQKEQVAQSLKMNLQRSKTNYMSALEKYHTKKSNLELSQKIYKRSLTRFKKGMISSTELTQNQNQMLNTQSTFYQAIYELLKAKNELDKTLNDFK
ncbi:MAG: TolC family protein [Bacteroidales bacterium]|nr:TolC family protein [Bacteroidales bacterium]MCF8326920.1 TolC family protein [Bacteroidales bacterium]